MILLSEQRFFMDENEVIQVIPQINQYVSQEQSIQSIEVRKIK